MHQFLVPSKSVINAAKSEYFSVVPSNCATKSSIELSFFVNVVLTWRKWLRCAIVLASYEKTDLAKIFVLTTYSSLNSDALLRELLEDAACRVVSVIIHIVVGFLVGVVPQWSASWLVIFWLIFITTFKKLWKNGSEIDDVCNRCCAVYFFFLKWRFLNFSNKKLSIHFFKMALFKPE